VVKLCKKLIVKEDYDRSARHYDRRYSKIQGVKFNMVSNYLPESGLLFDLGSGTALILKCKKLRRLRYIGIDISPEMTKIALKKHHFYKNFIIGDVEHLPLRDGPAENICSFTVLQNLEEQACFIKEVRRIIAANGVVILSALKKSLNLERVKAILDENHFKIDKIVETPSSEDMGLIIFSI